ncbi:hypothetical protein [Methanobrevibacter sp.]|uniref:hypothetical protein n=1 Tax=Methanobrevibacter sp. TaxID=66852 RepID=UPI0038900C06
MKSYSELIRLHSFEERFRYLRLNGVVANETFGFDRYLNQRFYRSPEWKRVRQQVIVRDNGNDMGCPGYPIRGDIIVHHINPVSIEDLEDNIELLLDPENLICVSLQTHNAIHYGDDAIVKEKVITDRRPGDTKLW